MNHTQLVMLQQAAKFASIDYTKVNDGRGLLLPSANVDGGLLYWNPFENEFDSIDLMFKLINYGTIIEIKNQSIWLAYPRLDKTHPVEIVYGPLTFAFDEEHTQEVIMAAFVHAASLIGKEMV